MEFKYGPIILIIVGITASEKGCCEEYCFTEDPERIQLSYLSSKTSYNNDKLTANAKFEVPNCTPVKFWMLSRHGTRYPTAKEIGELQKLQPYPEKITLENYLEKQTQPKEGALCDDDLNLLNQWKWDYNITGRYDSFLTETGWNEIKNLGIRLQKTFPILIPKKYNNYKFLFRAADTDKTIKSYEAFVAGVFGSNARKVNLNQMPTEDTLLLPYNYCTAFKTNSENLKHSDSQVSMFEMSSIYQDLIADVSTKLGFKDRLSQKLVETMYEMCRFGHAWNRSEPSSWCMVFTPKQIKIMEYKQDLLSYYTSGYGFPLSSTIPCFTISDMIEKLDKNETTAPHVVTYFTDSTMIQMFITALGVFKDPHSLLAEKYNTNDTLQRKWRTSSITPFGANVIAVKYHCPESTEKYKVMMFLNEQPIEFRGCNAGLCDWTTFKKTYSNFDSSKCKATYCNINKSAGTIINFSIYLMFIETVYLFLF